MEEKKIAHLGFIETTITRMASNSASIKGWSVGILAALIGIVLISNQQANLIRFILLGCSLLITLAMWGLDSFYLYQENLYRELYDIVKIKQECEIDFSMNARFETIKAINSETKSFKKFIFNRSIWPFYSIQLIAYLAFFLLPAII